jgi:hypothetical protein
VRNGHRVILKKDKSEIKAGLIYLYQTISSKYHIAFPHFNERHNAFGDILGHVDHKELGQCCDYCAKKCYFIKLQAIKHSVLETYFMTNVHV